MLTFAKNLLVIDFNFIDVAPIENDRPFMDWLSRVAESEGYSLSALSYIFCNDQYLLGLNQTYLSHDTLTDIITFDYVEGTVVSGDIFISVDRLKENAAIFLDWFSKLNCYSLTYSRNEEMIDVVTKIFNDEL